MGSVDVFLCLLVMTTLAGGIQSCPVECSCSAKSNPDMATCLVNGTIDFLANLSSSITHLKIVLPSPTTGTQVILNPDFNHLYNLRVLLYENEGSRMYSLAYLMVIGGRSLSNCTSLTTIASTAHARYEPDAFYNNSQLTHLHIENTAMNWQEVASLSNTSLSRLSQLRTLIISNLGLNSTFNETALFKPNKYFGSLSNISIESLSLSNNAIHTLDTDLFSSFPYLQYLDMRYNMFSYPSDPTSYILTLSLNAYVPNIDYSNQGKYKYDTPILRFEDYSKSHKSEITPTTRQEPLRAITGPRVPSANECFLGFLIPLMNIEHLRVSDVPINPGDYSSGLFDQPNICFLTPNNVTFMDASSNAPWMVKLTNITRNIMVFGLDKLQTLNVQDCALKNFAYKFIDALPSLKTLLIGRNNLGKLIEAWDFHLTNATPLEVLDISQNHISKIPSNSSLHWLTSLTHLNMSGNYLTTWTVNLSRLVDLQLLNLSDNLFCTLSPEVQVELDALHKVQRTRLNSRLITLDLTNNPLSCICSDIHFVDWFHVTQVGFHGREHYVCTHPRDGPVPMASIDLEELNSYCNKSRITAIVLSATMSALGTAIIAGFVALYCKRWHLRYWWYVTQKGWHRLQGAQDRHEYDFDVFVAHSNEDACWVLGPMLHELETKYGLRLCVYERDIQPGEVLVEAICDRVERSRHTLLVLSPNFVASNWCIFELHIAQTQLAEHGKDVVVSVVLKTLPEVTMHETLFKVLMKKVYLEWTEDEVGQKLFWAKLASVLGADINEDRQQVPRQQTRLGLLTKWCFNTCLRRRAARKLTCQFLCYRPWQP